MSRFHTIKGLFGQLIHYKDGVRVGESWQGLFDNSYRHYSNTEGYVGRSDPGLFADQVHRNANGEYQGESWKDDFGITRHYDQNGFAGSSHEDLFGGTTTDLFDDPFDSSDQDATLFDDFSDSDW